MLSLSIKSPNHYSVPVYRPPQILIYCPTPIILHNLMTVRILAEKYTSWRLQLCTFLQFPLTSSSPLDPNIFSAPYFRTPLAFVLLKVGDKLSLPCSCQPATDRCTVTDQSVPRPPMLLFKIYFNIFLQFSPFSSKRSLFQALPP